MANQQPSQFGGSSRFGSAAPRPGQVRPQATGTTASAPPLASRGLGLGKGAGGLGKGKGVGKGGLKRHMLVPNRTLENRTDELTGRFNETPSMALRRAIFGKYLRKQCSDSIRKNLLPKPLADQTYRRLARRGGVKRISAMIYDDVRQVLKTRLALVCFPAQEYSTSDWQMVDSERLLRHRGVKWT
jgi:histone H4